MPSNQRRIIEQVKFAYSPLRKAFEKQTKAIGDKDKKQIKALEYHGKQLFKSNNCLNLLKIILISIKTVYYLKKQFHNLKEKINPNNLIYKYKAI